MKKIKKILRKVFNKSNKNKNLIIKEYSIEERYQVIKKAVSLNVIAPEACINALMISCEYNKNNAQKIIKKLYKNSNEEFLKNSNSKIMISFIIPTYKRKEILSICIDSILMQSYKNYEIIIIDDNSPDDTESYIKNKYKENKFIYIKNEQNQGPGYNRKIGFKKAIGDYIIFCDDDDFYIDPNFLLRNVNELEKYKKRNIAFITSPAFPYPEKSKLLQIRQLDGEKINNNINYLDGFMIKYKKPLSTFTTLFNRNNLIDAGIYDMILIDDSMIYMRSLLCGDAIVLKNFVGMYRITQNSVSSNISIDFLLNLLKETNQILILIKEKKFNIKYDEWWHDRVISICGWAINKKSYSLFEIIKLCRFISKIKTSYRKKTIKKILSLWINS